MISSLRLRMMTAVSLLAIGAVVTVALAARQRTRAEFHRFQELERISATSDPDYWAALLPSALTDHSQPATTEA